MRRRRPGIAGNVSGRGNGECACFGWRYQDDSHWRSIKVSARRLRKPGQDKIWARKKARASLRTSFFAAPLFVLLICPKTPGLPIHPAEEDAKSLCIEKDSFASNGAHGPQSRCRERWRFGGFGQTAYLEFIRNLIAAFSRFTTMQGAVEYRD